MSSRDRSILTDQTEFRLPPEQWEAFCQRLEEAAKIVPALRQLFSKDSEAAPE